MMTGFFLVGRRLAFAVGALRSCLGTNALTLTDHTDPERGSAQEIS